MSEEEVVDKNGPAEEYNDAVQKEELPASNHSSKRMSK
jgi:hypothetical protein